MFTLNILTLSKPISLITAEKLSSLSQISVEFLIPPVPRGSNYVSGVGVGECFLSPCCFGSTVIISWLPGHSLADLWSNHPVCLPFSPLFSLPEFLILDQYKTCLVFSSLLPYALIALSPESTQCHKGARTPNFFPISNMSPTEHLLPNLKTTTSSKYTYKTK